MSSAMTARFARGAMRAAAAVTLGGSVARADAQAPPSRAVVARVADSLAKDFIADHGAPGVSIAVVRGTDTLVFGGWGKADLENDVPATAHTVYRIGSITKQFTSSTVMQLVESGKVHLDDSIGTYLTTLPDAWRVVTVRQLLNHTSGIPSYTDIGDAWTRRWGEEMTPDTLVALTAKAPMWFAPGTQWRYDNSGYVVLGMLIEKITGHPWATGIQERFAKPLGLRDTENCLTQPLIPHRARGYQPEGDGWENATYLAMTQPFAAGALCSSVGDLARWNRALASGQVVSAESYHLMTTPEGVAATAALHYGFGLGRDTLAGHDIVTHGGGIPGFISANVWIPDASLSLTVLTNSGAARPDGLLKQIARAALGVPLVQPPKAVTLTAAERGAYVGVYALALPGGARDFTVSERSGALYAQLAGQGAFPLTPLGNHAFGAKAVPNLRITFTVEQGRATQVVLEQGGGTFTGPRK